MPYGLSSVQSVFQCFINDVLRDFLGKFVIVYSDDILIYSADYISHIKHVNQVLAKLKDNYMSKAKSVNFILLLFPSLDTL